MGIKNQKRWLYTAVAVVTGTLLIELLLQSIGLIHAHLRLHPDGEVYDDRARVILCIGESTTGFGLSKSYPAQLQKKLNALYGQGVYRVVNEGWPGTNSSHIAAKLDKMMRTYRPAAVISMIGVNDPWGHVDENFWGELRLVKIYKWLTGAIGLTPRLSLLSEIQTDVPAPPPEAEIEYAAYRALRSHDFAEAKRLYQQLEESGQLQGYAVWFMAITRLNLQGMQEAVPYFERFTAENVRAENHWLVAGYIYEYYTEEEKDFVIRHLQRALELDADHLQARWLLALMYRNTGRIAEAETEFLRLLEYRPCDATGVHSLFKLYERTGQSEKAAALTDRCGDSLKSQGTLPPGELYKRRPTVKDFMLYRPMQENYRRIAGIIREHQALHVAMQYPLHDVNDLRGILRDEPGVVFVSNRENFEELLKQHRRDEVFTDNFAAVFGHSTVLGNQAIADAVIKALTAHGFLPPPAVVTPNVPISSEKTD